MSASNAFVSLSATFDGNSIDGVTDVSASINGTPVDLVTDAETSVESVFVDAIAADVTVTTTAIDECSSMQPGDAGSLVIVFQKRAEGRGAAGSGNKTATAANAVLTNITPSAATTGIGSLALTFRCAGPDSASPIAWS